MSHPVLRIPIVFQPSKLFQGIRAQLCLALAIGGVGLALVPADLAFHASFDQGSVKPDRQPIASSQPVVAGDLAFVPGRTGKALRLRNGLDSVSYYLPNYNARQGTITFWLSAENWDASSAEALQVLCHTGSNDVAKQQLVIQTLAPSPGLGLIAYRQGEPIGGPAAARTFSAPLRRAADAMSVLRKGEWYHYAVTWRDGLFRYYFNGQPVAKQQLDKDCLTDIGQSFVLGWSKDSGRLSLDPGDAARAKALAEKPWENLLDDFAWFRCALSEGQVEQVFKHGPVEAVTKPLPDEPAFALKADFLQRDSRLWAIVTNLNTPDGKERRGILEVIDATRNVVAKAPVLLPAGEAEVETILELPSLAVGRYTVAMQLGNGGGKPFVTDAAFERVKPPWLGNQLGAADVVLAPWTPVKVIQGTPLQIEVWGRAYSFAGPLPCAIVSQNEPLLAKPVTWLADTGAGEAAVEWSAPVIESASATAVVLVSKARVGDYRVEARSRIEYDGFLWSEFRFRAAKPLTVRSMRLEIPLAKSLCRFFQHSCRRDNHFPKPGEPWTDEFGHSTGYLMASNDRVGLQWISETDQWWHAVDRKKQLEVAATADGGGAMRIHFVRDPIEMPADFSLSFGLMATPVRVRPADWRGWGNATPYRRGHRDKFFPIELDYSNWSVGPGWVKPGADRRAVWKPGNPQPWLPFTSGNFYALRHFRDQENPDNWFPEWRQFHPEWWREPDPHSNVKGVAWNEGMVNPSPSFIDHFVWDVNEFFRDSNPDGLYFDGFPGQLRSANRRVGFGYIDRDGKVRPTFPLRAGREMMRRVYAVIQQHRGDQAALLMHTSLSTPMPILSFSHAVLDGEFMFWSDIKQPMEEQGPLVALTDDRLRSVLCMRHLGLIPDIDARMLAATIKDVDTARRVMAEFLHHDIHCWGDVKGYNPVFAHVIDWWGIADPQVEYIGHWDERPAATVFMGRASAYLNRAKGKVLLVCTNDGGYGRNPERFAAEKQWGYHVKLDLARLGLAAGGFTATDAESLGGLPVRIDNGDTLSLRAEPNAVMLVAIEAKPE